MTRRKFMALVGGMALCPLRAIAQEVGKVHRVAYIITSGAPEVSASAPASIVATTLHGLGYVQGGNLTFEIRSAEGKGPEYGAQVAAELIQQGIDVIVVGSAQLAKEI